MATSSSLSMRSTTWWAPVTRGQHERRQHLKARSLPGGDSGHRRHHLHEYRKYIEKDAALERRFQPGTVAEPSVEDAVQILLGIKGYYESYHRVKVSEKICRRMVVLAERYINDRYLPDKAIDLLDEACACAALRNKKLEEYDETELALTKEKNGSRDLSSPIDDSQIDYEELAKTHYRIATLEESLDKLKKRGRLCRRGGAGRGQGHRAVDGHPGLPRPGERAEEAGEPGGRAEAAHHRPGRGGVRHLRGHPPQPGCKSAPGRHPASFIFVGPTGTGKTELVRVLSQELFDTPETLIRLDMSEFMEKHSVSKIIGSPPGYVGYDEAGQLTEKVRRRPYSVLLFDEIEKAHPDVLNILLQILDEGRITDAHGRTVNFENTVIVMTSNAGSDRRENSLGFNKTAADMNREKVMRALGEFLRPEFLSRIDEVIVFRPLGRGGLQEDCRPDAGRVRGLPQGEGHRPHLQPGGVCLPGGEVHPRAERRPGFAQQHPPHGGGQTGHGPCGAWRGRHLRRGPVCAGWGTAAGSAVKRKAGKTQGAPLGAPWAVEKVKEIKRKSF